MKQCKRCRSYAINHNLHGRDGSDGDLCDVCYWRKRAEASAGVVLKLEELAVNGDVDAQLILEDAGINWQ